jgi:hypothetical protein
VILHNQVPNGLHVYTMSGPVGPGIPASLALKQMLLLNSGGLIWTRAGTSGGTSVTMVLDGSTATPVFPWADRFNIALLQIVHELEEFIWIRQPDGSYLANSDAICNSRPPGGAMFVGSQIVKGADLPGLSLTVEIGNIKHKSGPDVFCNGIEDFQITFDDFSSSGTFDGFHLTWSQGQTVLVNGVGSLQHIVTMSLGSSLSRSDVRIPFSRGAAGTCTDVVGVGATAVVPKSPIIDKLVMKMAIRVGILDQVEVGLGTPAAKTNILSRNYSNVGKLSHKIDPFSGEHCDWCAANITIG